eukprot:TRINITY_DN813_c0_g1_i2.p1 TRINITY_DN813_c0_g1~~TRINITY_DN813_c0_g1_i2.p1  ORF type:complete len:162 (-),score=34.74 TRINITY_DN813_c0_g1_i2:77-562(-)
MYNQRCRSTEEDWTYVQNIHHETENDTDTDDGNDEGYSPKEPLIIPINHTQSETPVNPAPSTKDAGNSSKKRKRRTSSRKTKSDNQSVKKVIERKRATPEQVSALQKLYLASSFPTAAVLEDAAKQLDMPLAKVKNWFQNKRAKDRRTVPKRKKLESPGST